MSIITLLSDFGLKDTYAAEVLGVIYSINPEAKVAVISHEVPPGKIAEAAFLLGGAGRFFPAGTVHLVMVNPGAAGRLIIYETTSARCVAPDNGVLSYLLPDTDPAAGRPGQLVRLGPDTSAFAIDRIPDTDHPQSVTFRRRDTMATVAAYLSLGHRAAEFGAPLESLFALSGLKPAPGPGGVLQARIIHVDRFGNFITNVREEAIRGREIIVHLGYVEIRGLCGDYAEKSGLLALIGSSGYLEVSFFGGSAADQLGLSVGDPVTVKLD
jgi:S-adenosylmethionine hydrolase